MKRYYEYGSLDQNWGLVDNNGKVVQKFRLNGTAKEMKRHFEKILLTRLKVRYIGKDVKQKLIRPIVTK